MIRGGNKMAATINKKKGGPNGALILYLPEGKRIPEIPVLCALGKIRLHTAGPADLGRKISDIAGLKDEGKASADSYRPKSAALLSMTQPVLVFCKVPSGLAGSFIDALSKKGIHIPLKAFLTEGNASWTLAELYNELREEHHAMTGETV